MGTVRIVAFLLMLASIPVSCGPAEETSGDGLGEPSGDAGESSGSYRVVLGNALTDTLRGEARFGVVVEPETGDPRFVIRLASSFDFAGGVVIARRDTSLPVEGSRTLAVSVDSLAQAPPDEFLLFYREGMLRDMGAASGTLNLASVTDTLIVGTFDVNLQGRVAGTGRPEGPSQVHAVGRFRAEHDLDGFVIGF